MSAYEDPSTWRLKIGSVPVRLVERSGEFNEKGCSGSETFLVPANQILALANSLYPTPYISDANNVVYPAVWRMPGLGIPVKKLSWKAHIDGIPIDPFGGDDNNPPDGTYQDIAEVTIDYETGGAEPSGDSNESDPNDPTTFLEISANGTADFLYAPSSKAEWESPGGPGLPSTDPVSSIAILVPETEWTVTWPRMPYAFFVNTYLPRMRLCMGKVNDRPGGLFSRTQFALDTLLFTGWDMSVEFSWRGKTGYSRATPFMKVSLKFLEKQIWDASAGKYRGHNDAWKPDDGWSFITIDGILPLYSRQNLNLLFA